MNSPIEYQENANTQLGNLFCVKNSTNLQFKKGADGETLVREAIPPTKSEEFEETVALFVSKEENLKLVGPDRKNQKIPELPLFAPDTETALVIAPRSKPDPTIELSAAGSNHVRIAIAETEDTEGKEFTLSIPSQDHIIAACIVRKEKNPIIVSGRNKQEIWKEILIKMASGDITKDGKILAMTFRAAAAGQTLLEKIEGLAVDSSPGATIKSIPRVKAFEISPEKSFYTHSETPAIEPQINQKTEEKEQPLETTPNQEEERRADEKRAKQIGEAKKRLQNHPKFKSLAAEFEIVAGEMWLTGKLGEIKGFLKKITPGSSQREGTEGRLKVSGTGRIDRKFGGGGQIKTSSGEKAFSWRANRNGQRYDLTITPTDERNSAGQLTKLVSYATTTVV